MPITQQRMLNIIESFSAVTEAQSGLRGIIESEFAKFNEGMQSAESALFTILNASQTSSPDPEHLATLYSERQHFAGVWARNSRKKEAMRKLRARMGMGNNEQQRED